MSVNTTAWAAAAAPVNTRNRAVMVALAVERWVVAALFLLLDRVCPTKATTVVLVQLTTTLAVAVEQEPLVLLLPVKGATAAQG